MQAKLLIGALLLAASTYAASAEAADDYRVMKLEQEMRNLERQVQTLERQVHELQRTPRASAPLELNSERNNAVEAEQQWLSAAAWKRIQPGMDELQVIEILGRPTALRPDATGRRALLYTLEIGATGFLTGSISFVDGKVADVQRPTLR